LDALVSAAAQATCPSSYGHVVVSRAEVALDHRSAHVWTGGQGEPVVLLHGAWGGARLHWAPVWDELAERFLVIAPDLPGLADDTQPAPRSFDDAAAWVEQLLETMNVESAWIVGNSFGAAVAWRTAARAPSRCRGLVLVNGAPPPTLPRIVRMLATRGPIRWMLDGLFRRNAYSPSTLQRAFADPTRAPTELRQLFGQRRPRQFDITSNMVLAGDPPVPSPNRTDAAGLGGRRPPDGHKRQSGQTATPIDASRAARIDSRGRASPPARKTPRVRRRAHRLRRRQTGHPPRLTGIADLRPRRGNSKPVTGSENRRTRYISAPPPLGGREHRAGESQQ
jgi:pimeloyl-ACP methyl ester carboxylesterase